MENGGIAGTKYRAWWKSDHGARHGTVLFDTRWAAEDAANRMMAHIDESPLHFGEFNDTQERWFAKDNVTFEIVEAPEAT